MLSPPSKPTLLSVQNPRESTYKENDREGRVSHWGTERETEAVTKEEKEELGWGWGIGTVCEKKKKEKKKSGNERTEQRQL